MPNSRTIVDEQEMAAAWKLLCFNWLIVSAASIAFGAALMLTNFRIQPLGYLATFVVVAAYGLFGYYNATSLHRRNPRIAVTLTALAQTISIIAVLTSLSYVAASANLPLVDEKLLAFDRALGFDFRSYLDFVNNRRWLISIFVRGYDAINWEVLVVAVALPLAGYYRRVAEFICAFALALIATICISMVVPAIGVYGVLGLNGSEFPNIIPDGYPVGYSDTLRFLPLLRDGTLRTLDIFHLAGVLTFPSFHAVSAVLYAWAFWPIRTLRPLNLCCNGAMLASTPVGGGHFLVDIIAGIGLAIASACAARRIGAVLAKTATAQENPAAKQGMGNPAFPAESAI
jgi:hypothetical protein